VGIADHTRTHGRYSNTRRRLGYHNGDGTGLRFYVTSSRDANHYACSMCSHFDDCQCVVSSDPYHDKQRANRRPDAREDCYAFTFAHAGSPARNTHAGRHNNTQADAFANNYSGSTNRNHNADSDSHAGHYPDKYARFAHPDEYADSGGYAN